VVVSPPGHVGDDRPIRRAVPSAVSEEEAAICAALFRNTISMSVRIIISQDLKSIALTNHATLPCHKLESGCRLSSSWTLSGEWESVVDAPNSVGSPGRWGSMAVVAACVGNRLRQQEGQNVKRYHRLLERVTEELDRQTIRNLLAEEQQKQSDTGDPI
jgi:hypothetical protein